MATDGSLRRTVLVVAGLSILAVLALAGLTHFVLETGPAGAGARGEPAMVEPVPNGSELWPYTSRARGFGGRTLAINVIAMGDADAVRAEFRRQVEANWTTQPHPTEPENATEPVLEVVDEEVVWFPAHGADRYTFVRSPDGEGRWLGESYQLYDGSYLGSRHHVRAYQSPADDWTAMQAHREYWDWFRLRHTVTSIADAQRYVDEQFLADERVDRVYKVHLGNGNSADGNGWATVLEFAALGSLLVAIGGRSGLATARERVRRRLTGEGRRHTVRLGLLFGAMLAIYLGVRVGGIALEQQFRSVSPKVIAGGLYGVLALGPPTAAYALSRELPPEDAFATAIAGFVAAFVLEYGSLQLEVVPVELLLHRVALLLSLGLVAAAGAFATTDVAERGRLLAIGVAGWIVSLGMPLLGLI